MLKTMFISNCTENDIDELKIASLYFDKIEIKNNSLIGVKPDNGYGPMKEGDTGVVTGITNFVTDDYISHIDTLIKENIVSIITDEYEDNTDENEDYNLREEIRSIANRLLSKELGILFEEKNIKYDNSGEKVSSSIKFSDETKGVHEVFVNPLKLGAKVDLGFIIKYYSSLLESLLFEISNGTQCLTSSEALNKFLFFYQNNEKSIEAKEVLADKGVSSNLALNAIKLAAPNISAFPFDEILEMRLKANSELLEFRNELATLQFNLQENYTFEEIQVRSEEIVKHKLKPQLIQLKRKIESLDMKLPIDILEKFKDPKSYAPLIGTYLGAIPAHIATLLSLGLISITTAYEYILSRKEIRENGLYYLIKISDKYG